MHLTRSGVTGGAVAATFLIPGNGSLNTRDSQQAQKRLHSLGKENTNDLLLSSLHNCYSSSNSNPFPAQRGFLSKSRSSCLLSAPLSCQGEIKQNRTFSPQNKGVGQQRDSAAAVMAISETEKTLEGAAVGSSRDDLGRAKFIITSPHFHLLIPSN